MDPSRVIILSMFCNLPEYIEEKNAVEKTWGRDVAKAGFKQFFYSEADFNHAPGLVGNVLYVKSGSSRWSTYDKTMSALKYVQENFDYDVIVKTNMSTYVNIEILKQLLKYKEKHDAQSIYGNRIIYTNNMFILRGDFTVFNRKDCADMLEAFDKTKQSFSGGGYDDFLMWFSMYEKYGKDFYKRLKTVPSNCLDKYDYNKIKNACAIRLKTVNSMNGLVVSKLMVKFHDNIKKETRKFKFLPIFNNAQVKFKDKNEKVYRTPYAEAVYRFVTSTSFGKPMSPVINKRVVYTCIIKNYDTLKPIMYPGDGIDYICFTDDMTMATPRPWKLVEIPKDLRDLPPVKQQRVLKILPHIYLQDYQESLWIDANFQVNADLNYFFRKYDLQKCPIYMNKHPQRDCIYDEQKTCVKLGKDKDAVTLPQIERFRKEGFPRHYGLAETNLMLRSHADEKCNQTMESWAKILIDGSHRDQLSFDYCCWKHKLKYGHLHEQYRSADSKDFKIVKHDGLKNKLAVVIVNKDTEKLTNAAIRSLRKYVKTRPYDVVVFDNSEKTQYKPDMPNVTVINNTHGDFVDFQKIIKYTSVEKSKNGYASYKHAITVQFLFDSLKYDELVFIDSDVIIKRDFDFMKCGAAIAGDWSENIPARRKRFAPYVMYVNLLKVKKAGIRFLDTDRITGGSNPQKSAYYDTGCSFYEDVLKANLPVTQINWPQYVVHLGGGSWRRNKNEIQKFLNKYQNLLKDKNVSPRKKSISTKQAGKPSPYRSTSFFPA